MAMVQYLAMLAVDPGTGLPNLNIRNLTGQIVQPGTTTPVPIWEDQAKTIVIPSSQLTITDQGFTPGFWADTFQVLEWWDGTNRVVVWSPQGLTDAAQAAQAAAEALFAGIGDAVDAVALPLVQAAQDAATSASNAAAAAGGDVTGAVAAYLAAHPPAAAWSAIDGKPDTFTPSGHTHVLADLLKAAGVALSADVIALLGAADKAGIRTAAGAGTSSQSLTVGTSAGTVAAGDHTHSQYFTAQQVADAIAAAGAGGGTGVGNVVEIDSATAARVHPQTGLPLPTGVHVWWVCDTEPVNLDPSLDQWFTTA